VSVPVELHVLPLGACALPSEELVPGLHDGQIVHVPVAGYLIRLADERLVLVDTGMSRLHVDDPDLTWRGTPNAALRAIMSPEDSLLVRLDQLGLAPQDIDVVINTHLHFDHAGNNDLLGRATFFVQREQYDFALDNPSFPNQYWRLPALSYELVDGERELFDGLRVLPTPGHVPGHQSVVLDLPETGPVVLCGDAVYCQDNFDRDSWDGQADPVVARESAHRLRDLARERGAMMLYGHDPEQAKTLRWAPSASYT
jgi:N-acyl homoserine lactone hydrolase